MKHFFKSLWFKILAVILAILIVFTIIAGATASSGSPLSNTIGVVAEPFEYIASLVGRGANGVKHFFTRSSTYEKEIADLEKQVTEYQLQLADYEDAKKKVEQYEAFLSIKDDHEDYKVISATVIGKDAADNYTTFLMNKGSVNDVAVNDPVIYGAGQLIGVVTKVAPTYCVVSTILDPSVSISVYDIRTGESGYVDNTTKLAAAGNCRLSGLDRDTAISTGAVICTAGVGGIYPRDLVLGTVTEIQNDEHDISSYAVIEPGIDISEVTHALIITDFSGQGLSVGSETAAVAEDATSPDVQESTTSEETAVSVTNSVQTASNTSSSRRTTASSRSTTQSSTGPGVQVTEDNE